MELKNHGTSVFRQKTMELEIKPWNQNLKNTEKNFTSRPLNNDKKFLGRKGVYYYRTYLYIS